MCVCEVCGVSGDRDRLLPIFSSGHDVRIGSEDEHARPVIQFCTNPDCLIHARSEDLIGKAVGHPVNTTIYTDLAKTANSKSDQAVLSLIGMAQKSRSIVYGTEGVLQKLKNGALSLVFLDYEVSRHTENKIRNIADSCECPVHFAKKSLSLGILLNKPGCRVAGILNPDIADALHKMMQQHGR